MRHGINTYPFPLLRCFSLSSDYILPHYSLSIYGQEPTMLQKDSINLYLSDNQ